MDYIELSKKLEEENKKSIELLRNSLDSEKIIKEYSYKDNLINILIK